MQVPVMQALNVQNQMQQAVAQPLMNQQAFAAALERTASVRPEQVQETERPAEPEQAKISDEDRGEQPRRRSKPPAGQGEQREPAVQTELFPTESGSRIDLVV